MQSPSARTGLSLPEIVSELTSILNQDARAMLSLLAGSTFFFVVDFFVVSAAAFFIFCFERPSKWAPFSIIRDLW